jgi:ankyrin repeat protein
LAENDLIEINSNAKMNDDGTPLIAAAQEGHVDIVDMLLKKGADANVKMQDGATALILASQNRRDRVQIVGNPVFRASDFSIHASGAEGTSKSAPESPHLQIVRALLNNGADVNAKNKDGVSALITACERGDRKLVEILLEKNADVNAATNDGRTALRVASEKGYGEVSELLVKAGAK